MGSNSGIIARPWTDEERQELRRLVDDGMSLKQISEVIGRSHGAIQTMANKLRLTTWENVLPATRESIRHFASQGWSTSRIAKRFGVSAKAVDLWTGRAAQ